MARRRPIVSVSGLTRSNGNVSQAGSNATDPSSAPATAPVAPSGGATRHDRSSPSRSASTPVAVTTRRGARSLKAASPATATA